MHHEGIDGVEDYRVAHMCSMQTRWIAKGVGLKCMSELSALGGGYIGASGMDPRSAQGGAHYEGVCLCTFIDAMVCTCAPL